MMRLTKCSAIRKMLGYKEKQREVEGSRGQYPITCEHNREPIGRGDNGSLLRSSSRGIAPERRREMDKR